MEECLDSNPVGGLDPAVLRQLLSLALDLRQTSCLFGEKAVSFAGWAEAFYNARKQPRRSGPDEIGARRAMHFMRCDLLSMRIILGRLSDC